MGQAELIGQLLDQRYRVAEQIGEGAMGRVYRGERIKLGRAVAIKVLHENVPDEAKRRRFEREALAMAKLEHPHCAAVVDVGVHDGYPYVVMEFVSGQNVKDLLAAGPLPIARAIEIMRQVLSGLSHAHGQGLIHRDIKPANVMLSHKDGLGDHAKLLDFGLARFVDDSGNLTGAFVLGTPNYMAPEQIAGGQIDHRVDLYACGVMLFELLTGTKPFEAADPMAICMHHLHTAPPTLASKLPDRDFGRLEDVVARALAKDRQQRFDSAEQFSRALVKAARDVAPAPAAESTASLEPAARERTPRKRGGRMIAIAGGVAAVAAIVVGVAISGSTSRGAAAVTAAPAPAIPSTPSAAARPIDPDVAPTTTVPAPPTPPADPPVADPVADLVSQAASGRRDGIAMLMRARKTYPQDARIPYEIAKLYLSRLFVPDGLKNARAAIALDPAYKNDPDLIKGVLMCFNATAYTDWTLAAFLHDEIGPAAKPFLVETAATHPNPIVRARAASELKRYR